MNWKEATKWKDKANAEKNEWEEPTWDWDCNFILDFDGPILHLSSRFYSYGDDLWGGGTSTLYFMEEALAERYFDVAPIDDLKEQVEAWARSVSVDVAAAVKAMLKARKQDQ